MNNAQGIDVSKWDVRPIDFAAYSQAMDFVSVKVSEGTAIDPLFREQWAAARGRTVRIPYHFWRSFVDQKAAVAKVLEYLGDDPGELPVALDLEVSDGAPDVMSRVKVWAEEYVRLSGKWPIIYSRRYFLADHGAFAKTIWGTYKHAWLANCGLWLAEWPFDEIWSLPGYPELGDALRAVLIAEVMTGTRTLHWPSTPAPFKFVNIWQWTSRMSPSYVPGYYMGSGHKLAVDHNWWNLSRELFRSAFPIAELPPVSTPLAQGAIQKIEVSLK